jgi:FkbM family methyltransferase
MLQFAKKLASKLSVRSQQTLKRHYFARQIRRGTFVSSEPEFYRLESMVSAGDWVLDIGANIGHYTLRLSNLVGNEGRVFAVEPIPLTFELLAANSALSPYRNVTLLNMAASNSNSLARMEVPVEPSDGVPNFYLAHLGGDDQSTGPSAQPSPESWSIFTLAIDSLELPNRVTFVKIDVEGHEVGVVQGMTRLIARDRPLIVTEGDRAAALLESMGYRGEHLPDSPNFIWRIEA